MQAMQNELENLKIQSSQITGKVEKTHQNPQNPQPTEKVAKIPQQTASSAEVNQEDYKKNNMVFFRGGFAHSSQHRDGLVFHSDVVPAGAQDRPDKNGWYFGAGFDWNLTRNAWDLAPRTNVLAELMFEYKEFSSHVQGNALANMPTQLVGGTLNPHTVTVSQLSIYASPKIKFLEGNRFRPWIIPGVVFAGGAEYRVWKDFYAGADVRYHITGGKKDGINVDGLTAGGYLGIGF